MSNDKEEKESKERIAIFIDGSNLYYSLKALEISRLDFRRFVDLLKKDLLLVNVFYYNAPLDISIDPRNTGINRSSSQHYEKSLDLTLFYVG